MRAEVVNDFVKQISSNGDFDWGFESMAAASVWISARVCGHGKVSKGVLIGVWSSLGF